MEEPSFSDFLFDYVEKEQFMKYLRLVIIVCAYILFRSLYQGWAKTYHIKKEVERDEREKAMEAENKEKENKEKFEKLTEEAESFGWGKKTRKSVKLQEAIVEEQIKQIRLRDQTAYDEAEDHDIDYLLED